MKRKVKRGFFWAALMTSLLVGCADSILQEESTTANSTEKAETTFSGDEKTEQTEETGEEVPSSVADVEISDQKAEIPYAGEAFTKSVFATGGTMLYVCGVKMNGNYFLGQMHREEDVFQEFDVNMDEDMRVILMTVDRQEKCHILWMSVEQFERDGQTVNRMTFEKSCITVTDSSGRLENEIDVSEVFSSGKFRPFCFAVDEQGNYYFEREKELVQVTSDGRERNIALCDGWIEGIGTGKSGTIYCTYGNESGEIVLASLKENVLHPCDAQLPQAQASYAGIYAGTDSELLIFNKDSGIYACNDDGTEVRISAAELPVTGEKIAGYGVLSDGRVCIMTQEDGITSFYYIPAGK